MEHAIGHEADSMQWQCTYTHAAQVQIFFAGCMSQQYHEHKVWWQAAGTQIVLLVRSHAIVQGSGETTSVLLCVGMASVAAKSSWLACHLLSVASRLRRHTPAN